MEFRNLQRSELGIVVKGKLCVLDGHQKAKKIGIKYLSLISKSTK
jgi:hypothetical protein